eukprot:PITA_26988
MIDDYHLLITGLIVKEKSPTFEELTGILMQEEERWMNLKPQNADIALMTKKIPFIGKPGARQKGNGTPQENPFQGYSNSDWDGNLDDRRSITCYDFSIGSGVISLSNKKQSTLSLSSIEEEYQHVCVATYESILLRSLIHDVGEEKKDVTVIKCDN